MERDLNMADKLITKPTRVLEEDLDRIQRLAGELATTPSGRDQNSATAIKWLLDKYYKIESAPSVSQLTDNQKNLYKKEFLKQLERSPTWTRAVNHPPNSFIDACILSLYAPSEYENFEEHSPPNPEGEDFLVIYYRSRERIIEEVQYHIKKGLNGTSWAEVFKGWANEKGTDTKLVDNRIKSLREQGFITNETPDEDVDQYRGQYRLIKVITEDQWKFIEGVLNLPPQKGISLPKIL